MSTGTRSCASRAATASKAWWPRPSCRPALTRPRRWTPSFARKPWTPRAAAFCRRPRARGLQALLDGAGIANLILKGAALDILAWGRIGVKQSWDIDLLVTERDVAAAAELLSRDGYRLHKPQDLCDDGAWRQWIALAKECLFVHPRTGTAVELHWRVADTAALLPGVCALSPSRQVALAPGLTVRTLPADETFAYLCVHGTSHAWSRLKWLADLAGLVEGVGATELAGLRERAKRLGAGRCADVAIYLCAQVLDLPAARTLRRAFDATGGRGPWCSVASRDDRRRGPEIEDRVLVADGILASQLLFADGWRFVLGEIGRQWVSLDDRRRLALPRRWRALYHLARAPCSSGGASGGLRIERGRPYASHLPGRRLNLGPRGFGDGAMADSWIDNGPVSLPPRALAYGAGALVLAMAVVGGGLGFDAAWRKPGWPGTHRIRSGQPAGRHLSPSRSWKSPRPLQRPSRARTPPPMIRRTTRPRPTPSPPRPPPPRRSRASPTQKATSTRS